MLEVSTWNFNGGHFLHFKKGIQFLTFGCPCYETSKTCSVTCMNNYLVVEVSYGSVILLPQNFRQLKKQSVLLKYYHKQVQ